MKRTLAGLAPGGDRGRSRRWRWASRRAASETTTRPAPLAARRGGTSRSARVRDDARQHPYGIAVDAFTRRSNDDRSSCTIVIDPTTPEPRASCCGTSGGGRGTMAAVSTPSGAPRASRLPGAAGAVPDHQLPAGRGRPRRPDRPGDARLARTGRRLGGRSGILEGGLRKPLGAKEPLVAPADFKGKKIRAPQSQRAVRRAARRWVHADPHPAGRCLRRPSRTAPWTASKRTCRLIDTHKWYEDAKFVTATSTSGRSRPCSWSTRRSTTA